MDGEFQGYDTQFIGCNQMGAGGIKAGAGGGGGTGKGVPANTTVVTKLKELIPTICSGGGFGYAGTGFNIGFLKFESLAVLA